MQVRNSRINLSQIVAAPARVSGAVKENRVSALQAALLMLPDSFSQEELFEEIVALSYRGDFRMIIGEDKAKVGLHLSIYVVCSCYFQG